jgi:hypothetical protein
LFLDNGKVSWHHHLSNEGVALLSIWGLLLTMWFESTDYPRAKVLVEIESV